VRQPHINTCGKRCAPGRDGLAYGRPARAATPMVRLDVRAPAIRRGRPLLRRPAERRPRLSAIPKPGGLPVDPRSTTWRRRRLPRQAGVAWHLASRRRSRPPGLDHRRPPFDQTFDPSVPRRNGLAGHGGRPQGHGQPLGGLTAGCDPAAMARSARAQATSGGETARYRTRTSASSAGQILGADRRPPGSMECPADRTTPPSSIQPTGPQTAC
jgi:hypothetical protein